MDRKQNGHCNMPHNFNENLQLGIRGGIQRSKRKQNKLPPERDRLLNEIRFAWNVQSGAADLTISQPHPLLFPTVPPA